MEAAGSNVAQQGVDGEPAEVLGVFKLIESAIRSLDKVEATSGKITQGDLHIEEATAINNYQ